MKIQKSLRAIIVFLFLTHYLSSQVMISDSVFLQALIEEGVDTNQDGQIQLDEAQAVTELDITYEDISSLSGIEAFSNLTTIKIGFTNIDSADFTNNLQLTSINLPDNDLIEVQLPNLPQLKSLVLRNNEISSLDVSSFINLEELDLDNNNFSNLDLGNLVKLKELNVRFNNLSSLDIGNLVQMEDLDVSLNNLPTLDLSGLTKLIHFDASNNNLGAIDFSENPKLRSIRISNNNVTSIEVKHLNDLTSLILHKCPIKTLDIAGLPNLFSFWITDSSIETLYMRGTSPDPSQFKFGGSPLKYVCADVSYFPVINDQLDAFNITDCLVTSFCPYTDEGVFGGISGTVKFGQSAEDCDSSSNYVPYPKFRTEWLSPNGQDVGVLIGTEGGFYEINYYGTMTLIPASTYSPEWIPVDLEFSETNYSSNPQYHVHDFCFVPVIDKLETQLNIIPLEEFRAGFEANQVLLVRNTGTLPFSGTLTLNLPLDSLTYIDADNDPSLIEPASISWDIQNLLPFDEKRIKTTLRLNSPMDTPPIFGDEGIQLCLELTDADQYKNNICVNDFSVNSFDPNDKTYLGKDTVKIDKIEDLEKLTYLIRFENTGSAEAVNIAITDALDDTFIVPSSIQILDASHGVNLEMGENGVANFIFRNIYLPFEPGFNRGYVLFSVESRMDNISINDQINNNAAIYFDFNFPIITNEASIWIIDDVSSSHTTATSDENKIKIFPNPSAGFITIESKTNQNIIKKIEWTDANGKIQKVDNINSHKYRFNEIDLSPGIYIFRITAIESVQIQKVLIQGN